jgi:phage shock protein E
VHLVSLKLLYPGPGNNASVRFVYLYEAFSDGYLFSMKKLMPLLVVAAIIACLTACLGTAKKSSALPADPAAHPYASYDKLASLVSGQGSVPYLLLDVRAAEEYAEGHIKSAVNLPYDRIVAGTPDVPKDRLIIVYCRSGRRSALAAESLQKLGFSDIADFGGISNWKGSLEK